MVFCIIEIIQSTWLFNTVNNRARAQRAETRVAQLLCYFIQACAVLPDRTAFFKLARPTLPRQLVPPSLDGGSIHCALRYCVFLQTPTANVNDHDSVVNNAKVEQIVVTEQQAVLCCYNLFVKSYFEAGLAIYIEALHVLVQWSRILCEPCKLLAHWLAPLILLLAAANCVDGGADF